ncbi:MAG: DUF882 domain-containing protein [Motiliproteus sp.]
MKQSLYTRRAFIHALGGLTAGLAVSTTAFGKLLVPTAEMSLAFQNLHTGESLETTFCVDGHYIQQSMDSINHLLRDHRNGEVCQMDPSLMNLLHSLKTALGTPEPFHIISGYRSPSSNAMLSKKSNGVAKKSLHMQGKAIDIRVPGIDIKRVYEAALAQKGGGVGLYTQSDFIHLDVGRVRRWGV